MTKPFLKWAGGKYLIVDRIKKHFPKNYNRFVEPFLGAGSVTLNIDAEQCIANDFNADLINLWKSLQTHKNAFVNDCRELFIVDNNIKSTFNELKCEFNTTTDAYRKSVLFVYLNRHCFNGLWRYNLKGEFNVPFGKYDKPYFPQREFDEILGKIDSIQFHNEDFRTIFEMVQDGDVVYCDPPYLPLSTTSNFDNYTGNGFSLQDHEDLAQLAFNASQCGATVIISNHYNWYTNQIYNKKYGGKIDKFEVKRTLSSNIDKREPVMELLAIFKGTNDSE
jgi:DNA adenine methylase